VQGALTLPVGGQVALGGGFILSACTVDGEQARASALGNDDPFTAWLDADLTGGQFTVRARRAGDSFSPLGMDRQTVLLREFYINVKLPRRARRRWPLVCAGDQVAWVPGYRLAHPFRVTDTTKQAVKLELHGYHEK